MTVLEFQRICIVIPDSFLEEVLQKCRFPLELTKRLANMRESNNFLLEQVITSINLVGYALEIIPKTLASNCGMDVVRIITELRAKHAEKGN